MGVEVYVIAPQNGDEQGKRQVNDKHDAAVMCRRLSEYLNGHGKALSIVRILAGGGGAPGGRSDARAITPRAPRDPGDGAQPALASGGGGHRGLVEGEELGAD